MTFCTGNISVFAVEFECCIIVIEFCRLPVVGGMAFGAISFTILLKLVEMFVSMTRSAALLQSFKFLLLGSCSILPEMTSLAVQGLMPAGKYKSGF